ncbi:DUF4811 domain-containing protein [Enterococcus sp. LJL98]
MILVIFIFTVLGFSYFNILGTKKWQKGAMLLLGGLYLLALVVIVANDRNHLGMEKYVRKSRVSLVSSNPEKKAVLYYQAVGTKQEKIYFYRTEKQPNKFVETSKTSVKNQVSFSNQSPILVKQETLWRYKNTFYRQLFGIAKNTNQVIEEVNQFKLTDEWTIQEIELSHKTDSKKQP